MAPEKYEAREFGPHIRRDSNGRYASEIGPVDLLKLELSMLFYMDMVNVCFRTPAHNPVTFRRADAEIAPRCFVDVGYLHEHRWMNRCYFAILAMSILNGG